MHENSLKNLKPQDKKWLNYPTKLIRIPETLEKEILAYAHQLDEGVNPNQSTVTEKLSEIIVKIDNRESGYKTLSKQLIEELKSLIKS